jgi:hypothetical protein
MVTTLKYLPVLFSHTGTGTYDVEVLLMALKISPLKMFKLLFLDAFVKV